MVVDSVDEVFGGCADFTAFLDLGLLYLALGFHLGLVLFRDHLPLGG